MSHLVGLPQVVLYSSVSLSYFWWRQPKPLPCSLVFVILFGSAHGVVSIVRPVIAREILGGNNFGAKFGAMALLYLVGSASAPYLGSLIWGIGGYDLVLFVLVGLALIGMALYIAAHRVSALLSH